MAKSISRRRFSGFLPFLQYGLAPLNIMREAATQAGISNDHLEIVSEPETASIFCRHQTPGNFVGQYANLSDLKEGEQYMVLNTGGDSVDFTIHEVVNSRAVNEVRVVSCGCMGSENVDNKFLAFLEEITVGCCGTEKALSLVAVSRVKRQIKMKDLPCMTLTTSGQTSCVGKRSRV